METERVTAVRPLALADFLPCGRPAPLRAPPWVEFNPSLIQFGQPYLSSPLISYWQNLHFMGRGCDGIEPSLWELLLEEKVRNDFVLSKDINAFCGGFAFSI